MKLSHYLGWHHWKVTGAELMRYVATSPMGVTTIDKGPCTEVLMVCDCGKVKTICVDGHWTLEQLQPALTRAEADKEWFRKLGVKV